MQTDSLLNQPRAREVDLASLRSGTWTRQAPIKARRPPFDRLTIGLHWGTVLLVLVLFASAWLTRQSHFTPILLQIHRSSGGTIWVVTALRLAWRVTKASLPPFPKQISKLHRATAKLTEYGLYALLLGEPATGLLTTLFGGRPFALYLWQFPALMPRDLTLQAAFHFSHELGAGRSRVWPSAMQQQLFFKISCFATMYSEFHGPCSPLAKPHSHFLFMPQRHFITQKISTKIPTLELYVESIFVHCNSADDCSGYWKTISAR